MPIRKLSILITLIIITAVLSSCRQIAMGRAEIDKIFITRLISFDVTDKDRVRITITTKNLSVGAGEETSQKSESIVSEGDTVYDAIKSFSEYSDRKVNAGHTEFILFGESLARKGILSYLDFISRHPEFRYNAKVYVVKDDTASSFVERANTGNLFVGDRIARIEDNMGRTSLVSPVTLNEVLFILDEKNLDTFIPYIEPIPTRTTGEKPGTCDILITGYSLFSEDRLVRFLSKEQSRSINWLMNRITSGIITVKDQKGQEVSMVIIKGACKTIPRVVGNELHCSVEVSFTTNVGEIMGGKSVLDKASLDYLTTQQEKIIKSEVENTIKIAQENNSDHFSMISRFRMKYPLMWDYFRENWKELFPDIKFDVSVNSRIDGTYMINEPITASKEAVGE